VELSGNFTLSGECSPCYCYVCTNACVCAKVCVHLLLSLLCSWKVDDKDTSAAEVRYEATGGDENASRKIPRHPAVTASFSSPSP